MYGHSKRLPPRALPTPSAEANDMRVLRGMLCVLIVCQVFQALAIGLAAIALGPNAYALVVDARTFVDAETQASFRTIVHDVSVVARDLNVVERGGARVAPQPGGGARVGRRAEEEEQQRRSFGTLFDDVSGVLAYVDHDLIPVVANLTRTLAAAAATNESALPELVVGASTLARRLADLLGSDAPTEALSTFQDATSHVGSLVSMLGENGTLTPMIHSTNELMPRLNDVLDRDVLKRGLSALSSTWSKSRRIVDVVARTLNEQNDDDAA